MIRNKISVIMPVYNETRSELKRSIRSIQCQTYKNFELIIVDDNPSSLQLKKFLNDFSSHDTRIKLFFNKKNMGTVYTANRAISKSNGEFIARMDADDIALKNRLQYQLEFTINNRLDFSCCNYFSINGDNYTNVGEYSNISQTNQNKIKRTMRIINLAIGPTLFFKRSIINKIGGYRNILVEDYDLASRFIIHNCRFGYLSSPLIYKRERSNSLSNLNSLKEFVILDSISKYLRKYHFKRVMPLPLIYYDLKNINKRDKNCYRKFIYNDTLCKRKFSLFTFIKKYYYCFSSILVLKRNIIMYFYKRIQDVLLK